jgi:hypothetical protein
MQYGAAAGIPPTAERQKRVMMKCKCGHDISDHDTGYGCLADTDDRHVCKCNNEKDVIYQDYLAALIEAGNAMAIQLESIRAVAIKEDDKNAVEWWTKSDAAALAAWEQVTK